MKSGDEAKAAEATARRAAARVLLLVPARSYRAADFLIAAGRPGLHLVGGSDRAPPPGGRPVLPAAPGAPGVSAGRLAAATGPVDAVVAADTPMLVLAATVAARMGLAHSPVDAVTAAADKARQRRRWAHAGLPQPGFRIVAAAAAEDSLRGAAAPVGFPCVGNAVVR